MLVTDALVMAIWRRGKPDVLLHHSDRGSQYTSEQFPEPHSRSRRGLLDEPIG
jgi:transposase InsO family protein